MPPVICRVSAKTVGKLDFDSPPARWETASIVTMGFMCNVLILANVNRILIILAVAGMIAQRLHADFSALSFHDFCV